MKLKRKTDLRIVQLPANSHEFLKVEAKKHGLTIPQMLATMLDVVCRMPEKIEEVVESRKPQHIEHKQKVVQNRKEAAANAREKRLKEREELESLRVLLKQKAV